MGVYEAIEALEEEEARKAARKAAREKARKKPQLEEGEEAVDLLVGYRHNDRWVEVGFIENNVEKYTFTLSIEEAEEFAEGYMRQIRLAKEARAKKAVKKEKK